jgi:hypothetical protein
MKAREAKMAQEPPTSRNIPRPMRREIRQRCGFGYVICGLPLYEYEHMEEWAIVERHVADEITLLCDQHHREKTGGMLPKEDVRQANANPINLQQGASKPYALHFSGVSAEVELGGNWFTSRVDGDDFQMIPIIVDHTHLIEFTRQDNHLLLSVKLFDERNQLIMEISENQLIYSMFPWDITLVGRTLTIREGQRKIALEIDFFPPDKITISRGRFQLNGIEIIVKPDGVVAPGVMFSRTRMYSTNAGVCLNSPNVTAHCMFRNDHAPRRDLQGAAHVWGAEALQWMRPGDTLPGLPQRP